VLCSDGTADSADGDGVDIEARTCGSIHSKSKRCEPARVGFELALGEAVTATATQLGNCDAAGSTRLMGATCCACSRASDRCMRSVPCRALRRGAPGSLTRRPSPSCLCMRMALSKQLHETTTVPQCFSSANVFASPTELCCDAHKPLVGCSASSRRACRWRGRACGRTRTRHGARRRGRRATRQTSAAPAPAQRRAARSARCTAQTSTPACCRVASFERACVTKVGAKLRDAERQRLAAQHRGDQAFGAFAHLDARVEQCRARNLKHRRVDAPQRKAVAKREQLQHRQRDAARLPRRWSRRACAACRAARRRAQPTCRTVQAARRCVAPSARALGRCRAALRAPSARCAAARRQTPARASRRRARRRAAARAPPTARRRARQCTARARRPAATRRHGDEATRRNAHLREAQQRLAFDAALQDRRDARTPRRAAPAEHVHQRRRQVERARLRTRVADRRRVHRVAEPLDVQRVGEPCDAARVNAVRDEAQRRRNLDAEVEPVTAAQAEHTVLTQKRAQLFACWRALRRRPAARGPREPSKQLHGHDLCAALVV
jgi:hypothetical protein